MQLLKPTFIWFLLMLLPTFCVRGEQQTWTITSLEWPPYASKNMPNGGDAIAQLRSLLKKNNIKLKIEYHPWLEAQRLARNANYVGYFPAWPSEVNEGFVSSKKIATSELSVVAAYSHQLQSDLDTVFSNSQIITVDNYKYPKSAFELITSYANNVISVESDLALLRRLNEDNSELAIVEPNVIRFLAQRFQLKLPKTITQFSNVPLVLALRNTPDNLSRIDQLNTFLQTSYDEHTHYRRPKKLLLTQVDVPTAQPFTEFMQSIYKDLGIKTVIQTTPTKRGLLLVDAGIVDGDVVRANQNMQNYDNIALIEPSLGTVSLALLCKKNLPCNSNVLSSHSNKIISTQDNRVLLSEFTINAQLIELESIEGSLNMLKKSRADYIIYPATEHMQLQLKKEFNFFKLRDIKVNTILNKIHAPLIPELSKAISEKLNETGPISSHH